MSKAQISGKEAHGRAGSWLLDRARLMPDLLAKAPPRIRGAFDHAWAPMQALSRQLDCLPPNLWEYLLQQTGGYVYITTEPSRYAAGPGAVRHQQVQNVAHVSVEDLADENQYPLHVLGHLIDHYLGCRGSSEGRWLSEGGGATPSWQQAGGRLPRLFELGYGVDSVAQSNVRDYFAQSLAVYCQDLQRLNVVDPQIYKWFRSTLWNDGFWR